MRYFLVLLLLLTLSFGDDLSVRLENLIKNKHDNKVVFLKYDPFQIKTAHKNSYKPTVRSVAKPLKFVMTLNHQAFVDGRWFKEGDNIRGYTLEKIENNQIVVAKNGKKTTIGFDTKQNILKIRKNKHEN